MPTVWIPPPYRGPTEGRERVEVDGVTVGACIDAVDARHPGFRALVVDEGGRLHRFVRLFRNGEALERDALAAPIGPDDRLEVLSAIAGGSGAQPPGEV